MIELRDYQERVIAAIGQSLGKSRRVIAVAPTASGKSFIIAGIIARYLAKYPDHRVLVLTHTQEILLQNEQKIHALGVRDTGVYCAGLGRKQRLAKVTLASRDSLGTNPTACGYAHMIIVDEAHLVGEDEKTYYQRIFDAIQPKYLVGLTGTPWRLDNGLVYGKNKFWEVCADRITMEEVRDAGFLAPYILPPATPVLIDTSNVKVTAGEFNQKQLASVSMTDQVVESCVETWWLQAQDRRCSLFFCCSRDHAAVVLRYVQKRTSNVAYLDGLTSKLERERVLQNARKGHYRAIINVAVLTTGTDIPIIDCIVFLRATRSASLFVQMAGRALRVHPEKQNAIMLDYAGNFARFGSLENPRPPAGRANKEDTALIEAILAQEGVELIPNEAPQKTCPACDAKMHAAATRCEDCGHVFFNHTAEHLSDSDLQRAGIYRLALIHTDKTVTTKGVPCVIVHYHTECAKTFKEWLFPSVAGFQKWQAQQKIAALQRGATHVRVIEREGERFPKLSPLNLQSSGSYSLISLPKDFSFGDKTPWEYSTRG